MNASETHRETEKETPLLLEKMSVRPLRRVYLQLKTELRFRGSSDWNFARALYRNLSKTLKLELDYALQDESNSVIVIHGPMGGGKSTVALSIANHVVFIAKEKFPTSRLWITWSNDETVRIIEKVQPGDVILQDEIVRQGGEDSLTIKNQLLNISETIRKAQISFIYVSPVLKGMENCCNFVLYTLEKDRKKGRNRVIVHDGEELKPLGYAWIPKLNDPELEAKYETLKDSYIREVQEQRGFSFVKIDQERLEKDLERLWKATLKEFEELPFNRWKKGYLSTVVRLEGIPGSKNYLNHLVEKIWFRVVKLKVQEEIEIELRREKRRRGDDRPPQHLEFDNHLRHGAIQYLIDQGICTNRVANRWVLRKLNQEILTYSEIAEKTGDKRSDSVGRSVRVLKVSPTDLGNILEIALLSWIKEKLALSSSPDIASKKFVRGSGPGSCDLHVRGHSLCINAKLKLDRRPSWRLSILPEFENCPGESYLVLWTPERGLEIYKAFQEHVNTGEGKKKTSEESSCEEISLDALISRISEITRGKNGGNSEC